MVNIFPYWRHVTLTLLDYRAPITDGYTITVASARVTLKEGACIEEEETPSYRVGRTYCNSTENCTCQLVDQRKLGVNHAES